MIFEEKLLYIKQSVSSTWSGHIEFADWLMRYKRPLVTVELGVDYGCSTFSFALSEIGEVYAIDWFKGDQHTGYRDTSFIFMDHLKTLQYSNVNVMAMAFDDAFNDWTLPIDILHIDGLHTYDAVRNDYNKWTKHLKYDGVVLMHDTCIDWFGVKDFFGEIQEPKLNFINSCGLGVISKDTTLLQQIRNKYSSLIDFRY